MDRIAQLLEELKKLTNNKFYGKLTITFEAGKLVHLKKEESIKLR